MRHPTAGIPFESPLCGIGMMPLLLRSITAFCLFTLAQSCLAGTSQALSTSTDTMEVHYAAARDSLLHNDYERAITETSAFLAEALHRVANTRAQTGDIPQASDNLAE